MVVGWRLRRQPTTIHKHKTLIVISNEVRNLLQSFRYKVYQTTMLTNNYCPMERRQISFIQNLNHPPTPAPTLFRFYFARPPRAETGFEKKVPFRPGRLGIY